MTPPTEPDRSTLDAGEEVPAGEQTAALPVPAGGSGLVRAYPSSRGLAPGAQAGVLPAVQAAAAAAGGFVAGVALVGLVHRRRRRSAGLAPGRAVARPSRRRGRRRRGTGRAAELVQIVGSRSLLVDVHLLGER